MKIVFIEKNWNPETPMLLQKAGFEVIIPKEEYEGVHEFGRGELLSLVREVRPDILFVGSFKKIDKEILDNVGKAVFARMTCPDNIDLDYCKEKGIEVVHLKGEELGEVVAVPELVLGKMIELLRMGTPGYELKGKTLGLIGYGRISKLVEERTKAFGTTIKWTDSFGVLDTKSFKEDLEELLRNSDIVSLHISSTEENRNFFDKAKFEQMKNGSFFLNSARGWLVDESALKWALENKLNGAWSDFSVGFSHPALLVTNHIGGNTFESHKKTEEILVNKLIQWAKQQS